jgi:hypothetical protein
MDRDDQTEMNSRIVLATCGIIFLLVGGFGGYFYGANSIRRETTTTTFTTVSMATDIQSQVFNSLANHMFFLSERNVSAIISQYEKNATIEWMGNAGGLQGIYNGTSDIFLLMNESFISRAVSFSIGNITSISISISNDSAIVKSSFEIFGQDYNFGLPYGYVANFNSTILAQDHFAYSSSQKAWLISVESWNYHAFNS